MPPDRTGQDIAVDAEVIAGIGPPSRVHEFGDGEVVDERTHQPDAEQDAEASDEQDDRDDNLPGNPLGHGVPFSRGWIRAQVAMIADAPGQVNRTARRRPSSGKRSEAT